MDSQGHIALEDRFGVRNYAPLDVVLSKGKGIWVEDVDGNRYMDMLSSYSAVNQGHAHPRIVKALVEQAQKLPLTSRAFRNDRLGPFLEKLANLCEMEAVLPMNTGAEAVETAIKMARKWGYEKKGIESDKAEIIVCENNFHGRTTTIVGFSSDPTAYNGFGPATPGFVQVPFDNSLQLQQAITQNTAAVLVEPIQGEAGVKIPDIGGYLQRVRQTCTENDVLLMLDEIQTGFGRTGKLFCYEHSGIKPDALILGKALSGGLYPVSAVASSHEFLDVFTPGTHGSTYGGNPLACAVAEAALDVLIDENLTENSLIRGKQFLSGLERIRNEKVRDLRGKGLLIAMDIEPEYGTAGQFCKKLAKNGILAKDAHEQTVRFAPPLVITHKEIEEALKRIEKTLNE
jgi:ornithine--oxo-acid transaminase